MSIISVKRLRTFWNIPKYPLLRVYKARSIVDPSISHPNAGVKKERSENVIPAQYIIHRQFRAVELRALYCTFPTKQNEHREKPKKKLNESDIQELQQECIIIICERKRSVKILLYEKSG
ncbi:hypothetical protein EVAR_74719_1 [Eumeta japonica]|uniref:Uncharacterized protein n=1 Tax=Eumeta variegata TaxID=151549 RepID=A0A4C1SNV7_EUMVA|nr:hypothetical protein EVAR_74719_1 [Eumeta japonica]